jgi:hypothetical protein
MSARKNMDEVLAAALACGASHEQAAAKAGCSIKTVYRRMQDPEFMELLRKIRGEMIARACAALSAAALQSVQTLLALQDTKIPHATRLGAARAVLELGARFRVEGELAERLAAIEKQLRNSGDVPTTAPRDGSGNPTGDGGGE